MDSTTVSLLRRLRQPDQDAAWQRFVELYAPLIFHWGRNRGLNGTDATDLVQEVMAILVVKLPTFQYDPSQRFRGWLQTVTTNAARNLYRRESKRALTNVAESIGQVSVVDTVELFDEAEYRRFLVQRAMKLMQAEFQEQTWKACWLHLAEGRKAADVGKELGMTANAVHIAKCRVIRRLREELDGLVD